MLPSIAEDSPDWMAPLASSGPWAEGACRALHKTDRRCRLMTSLRLWHQVNSLAGLDIDWFAEAMTFGVDSQA